MKCVCISAIVLTLSGCVADDYRRDASYRSSEKTLTIGTPGVSFHQVANWVVVRAMERLGYNVTVVDQKPHRKEYPLFTNPDGPIDVFTGSDLPWNHAPWLWNHTDDFFVAGTVNEATDILLGVPSYAGVNSVSEFLQQKDKSSIIYSLALDTCPQCVFMSQKLADTRGLTVNQLDPHSFISTVKDMMVNKKLFAVSWYVPSWIVGELPGLKMLRGDIEPFTHHNAGKTLIRRDRMDKLDTVALSVLSAVFVGNEAITAMDRDVNLEKLTPAAAADKWIANNNAMFESFFSKLTKPQVEHGHPVKTLKESFVV